MNTVFYSAIFYVVFVVIASICIYVVSTLVEKTKKEIITEIKERKDGEEDS